LRRDEDLQARFIGWRAFEMLMAFSIITIAASTIAPIAIAMPPRLMMLEPRPSSFIAVKPSAHRPAA